MPADNAGYLVSLFDPHGDLYYRAFVSAQTYATRKHVVNQVAILAKQKGLELNTERLSTLSDIRSFLEEQPNV